MTFSTIFDINLLHFRILHNKRDFKLITHFLIYNMEYSEQFAYIFTPGVVITNNHLLISSKVCSIIYFSIFFDIFRYFSIFFNIFRYFSIYCNILTCGSNLLIFQKKKRIRQQSRIRFSIIRRKMQAEYSDTPNMYREHPYKRCLLHPTNDSILGSSLWQLRCAQCRRMAGRYHPDNH